MGRFLTGYGIGIFSFVVPVFIAEMASKDLRGGLTTLNQLMIVIGSSHTFLMGIVLSWRTLAITGLVPCIVLLIGLFFISESHRWLAKVGLEKEYEVALRRLRGKDANVLAEAAEIKLQKTLTPNMQSPVVTTGKKSTSKQETSSTNLWRSAFHDAFKILCPLRAGGHECGCLPVLARMVIERVARLDVAMFNAILHESAHEIPTDPISDHIVDSKVLPIPAGDPSFGSGAHLKNFGFQIRSWRTKMDCCIFLIKDFADSLMLG